MTYRDETETLRQELRQTSAELARVNTELMKRDAKPRTEIQYRDERDAVHEWVVISVLMLLSVSLSTFIAALLLPSGRATAAASVAFVLSTALLLRIWWKALPRVKVSR